MKSKFLFTFLMLCILLAMVACGKKLPDSNDSHSSQSNTVENNSNKESPNSGTSPSVSPVEDFMSFLLSNSYSDAISQYNTKIVGNTGYEAEAADLIATHLCEVAEGILSGTYEPKDAEIKLTTVDKIYEQTNIDIKNYEELTENIEKALSSKVAYKSGLALFASENWIDAIEEFSKVLATDCNYKDALEKSSQATENYRSDALLQAESYVSKNDYLSAINLLKKAAKNLPKDSTIAAMLNTYEKNYIAEVINNAEKAFVDYTKYEEALTVIRAALQHYPDNENLIQKRDYYLSFEPVNLYDMDKLRGRAVAWQNDVDSYGNRHEKCFLTWKSFMIPGDTDITYNLSKSYNTFDAVIYGRSNYNSASYAKVSIYADEKLIYQDLSVPDNSTPPYKIHLDVTGVSELRIVLSDGAEDAGIGMTDMYIQRTVK